MDRITESLIEELLNNLELDSQGAPKDFEKLVNYSIISNEYSKTFEVDSVTVGDGNDTGIDGIAIIVNGQLIESREEIDDIIERSGSLEVKYIFNQAKTSSSFNSGEIGTFLFGINDFFASTPTLVRNESIERFAEISNYLYSKASYFIENPDLKVFYVTTGKWTDDQNLSAVISQGHNNLEQKNLFDNVIITPLGAREIAKSYRKTKEAISTSFTFNNRVTLPNIKGISEAYIGLLPYSEFIKILAEDDGKLRNVFEDNVRDFQGDTNDVNSGIDSTINSASSDIFSVLNNGVTIVASDISATGDNFTIKEYQIVNGCQTSNVLYNNRNSQYLDKVNIPIKIISTSDDEIKNSITLATNNQTPIKKEQLASLTAFQRSLEQYYNSFKDDNRLYYERRSKQYNSDSSVLKTRIITVPIQIKSFSAMFLDNPHSVTSFFGVIVKRLNEGKSPVFDKEHTYIPYYTSAYAYFRLEHHFRRRNIDSQYKKVRFPILMILRMLINSNPVPHFSSSKQMEKFCNPILDILYDETKSLVLFNKCIEVINNSDFDHLDKQDVKLLSKTKNLIVEINK